MILPYGDDSKSIAVPTMQTDPEFLTAQAANANVSVDLAINDPSHTDQEVLQGHMAQAQVTLTPADGKGDPITLEQNNEDELSSTFIAPTVPAGEYTLAANLTTADGENYEGTEPVTVNAEDSTFNLTLTNTEVSG